MDKLPYVVLRAHLPGGPRPPAGVLTRDGSRVAGAAQRISVELDELGAPDAQRLGEQRDVIALAPALPMRLIAPRAKSVDTQGAADAVPWGIGAVGADRSDWHAREIRVAILDTGIDRAHEAFSGLSIVESDFTGTGNGDSDGHGTHCAAIAFGRTIGGVRCGVAPSVGTALIAKVLDDQGAGTTDTVSRAVLWALQEGAHVISMSLGLDFAGFVRLLTEQDVPVETATAKALEAYRENLRFFDSLANLVTTPGALGPGALLIAAGGNESDREASPPIAIGVAPPAVAEGVISVGALQQAVGGDAPRIASFSNTGPSLAAPGVAILAAQAGGGTVAMSGTSAAAPHVAGVAALWAAKMLAEEKRFDARLTANRLIGTSRRFAGWQSADVGAGLVQAPPAQ